jgi:hypothetical protein
MSGDWRLRLVVSAAAALTACHTALGPAPIDENWRTYESARVTFFVRPGSFAEQNVARLSEVLEDQFTSTTATLRLTYAGHLHAYAYNSAAEANFPSDYSGRAYPDTESFRFVAVPPMGDNLFQLMSHEANHALLINGLGRAGTYFMTEGLASAVLSETFHQSGRHFQFPWTRSHRAQIPPLSTLIDDGGWKRTAQDTAYKASASFLAWLLDAYGPDRLRQIYPLHSDQMLDRIPSIYGRPLDALEAEWFRFVETFSG